MQPFVFAAPGFYPLGAEHVPTAVQDMSRRNVFQVVLLNDSKVYATEAIDEQIIQHWARLSEYNASVLRLQQQRCLEQNLKKCRLWIPVNGLSGYTLGRGDMLVTVIHGLRVAIDSQARRKGYLGDCPGHTEKGGVENFPLCHSFRNEGERQRFIKDLREKGLNRQILVINSDRKIVYMPEKAKSPTKVALLPNREDLPYSISTGLGYGYLNNEKAQFLYNPTLDWVVLKMPQPIGEPLKIADETRLGETVTLVGYPMETHRPKSSNSHGDQLYFSRGKVLTMNEALELDSALTVFGYKEENNLIDFILTSTDGALRNSGGPYLNERGELVGMIKSLMGNVFDEVSYAKGYQENNPTAGTLGISANKLREVERQILELLQRD